MVYCEACLAGSFAGDLEEDRLAFATIDGVIRGLLEMEVPHALIRAAVDEALRADMVREREAELRALAQARQA
jgi:hypothetical protein